MEILEFRALFRFLVLVAIIQSVHGCEMVVGDPRVEIVTNQVNRQVRFEFFSQEKRWWSKTPVRAPAKVAALTLVDQEQGATIWQIDVRDVRMGATQINYGVIPAGFEQVTPKKSSAPPLEVGKKYEVLVYPGGSGKTTFIYQAPK
jgi:hypothetical protein